MPDDPAAARAAPPRPSLRFGDATAARPAAPPCSSAGDETSPTSCARSTPSGIQVAQLRLHAPTLDDVFLAKTGRTLEGEDEGENAAAEAVPA